MNIKDTIEENKNKIKKAAATVGVASAIGLASLGITSNENTNTVTNDTAVETQNTDLSWEETPKTKIKIIYKNCSEKERQDLTTIIDEDGYVYLIHKNKEDETLEGDIPLNKVMNFASSLYGVITIDTNNTPEGYEYVFELDYLKDTFLQTNKIEERTR